MAILAIVAGAESRSGVGLGEAALAAEALDDAVEPVGEIVEHEAAQAIGARAT